MKTTTNYSAYLDEVSLYTRSLIRRELEQEYSLLTLCIYHQLTTIVRVACLLTTYNELFDGRVFFSINDFNPNN